MSMALGGKMGEARTNLKKGSAAERLTDYLNYILGVFAFFIALPYLCRLVVASCS